MSEKKSPPRKEKPPTVKTPSKPEQKTLKRKLFSGSGPDEEEKKGCSTPKRKKSIASESSPNPAVSAAKTPGSINWPTAPLSERQQMALLMKMTAESQQQHHQQQQTPPGADSSMSPRPLSPSTPLSAKKTPQDKKVHKRNERGETALHIAAIKGDAKQTKRLIKAGADVNVRDFAGWTPLHEACNHGWLDVAKQLLKAGANVNVQGLDNDTPLHDASINGHGKLVELLLRHGANPLQQNSKGLSPLDVAASLTITQLLKKEIITSSSESSGLDEIRSPTSPESNLSDRDFDKDFDHRDILRNSPSPGSNSGVRPLEQHFQNMLPSLGRRASAGSIGSMAKSPDKINSPRLTLKFQPIRTKEDGSESRKSRVSKDHPFKSYSVKVEEGETERSNEKRNLMLPDSMSSPESDFFDPRAENPAANAHNKFMDLLPVNSSSDDKSYNIGSSMDVMVTPSRGRLSPSFHKGRLDHRLGLLPDHNKDKVKVKQEKDPYAFEDISDEEDKVSIKLRTDRVSDHKNDRTDVLLHHHHHHHHIPDSVRLSGNRTDRHVERERFEEKRERLDDKRDRVEEKHEEKRDEKRDRFDDKRDRLDEKRDRLEDKRDRFEDKRDRLEEKRDRFEEKRERLDEKRFEEKHDRFEEKFTFDAITQNKRKSRSRSRSPISELNHNFDKHCSNAVDMKHVFDAKHRWKESESVVSTTGDRPKWKESQKVNDEVTTALPTVPVIDKEKLSLKIDRDRDSRSPKSDTSNKSSPKSSPKSDRESRLSPKSEKESRSSSPKVPPLKIIIPPKTPTTEGDGNHFKKVTQKPAFPYVLNPTQEEGGELPMDTSEGALSEALINASVTCELSALKTEKDGSVKDSGKEDKKINSKEDKVTSSSKDEKFSSVNNLKEDSNESQPREDKSILDKDSVKADKSKDAPQRETRESARLKEKEMKEREKEGRQQKDKDGDKKEIDVDVVTSVAISMSSASSASSNVSKKEEEKVGEEQGQTQVSSGRCLRSQTKHLQQQKEPASKDSSDSNSANEKDNNSKKSDSEEANIHPRKRKLRQRQIEMPEQPVIPPPQHFEKPENPFELFLEIRKQVASRRKSMFAVQPKAPQGFKDYLMVSNNYILAGNQQSRLSVPMLTPPNSVQGPMREFFINQEKARYQLRLQHLIEREKLMLAIEQEILRVHGRAARAMANQSMPFSVCTVLRDDEIYNTLEPDPDEKDKNSRSRYNGRQFLSWLQDVDDKYEKIKERLLLRHHHEAESLYAVQKMEWEWKMKEVGVCDYKLTPKVDDVCVPMVNVSDEFDLLPA